MDVYSSLDVLGTRGNLSSNLVNCSGNVMANKCFGFLLLLLAWAIPARYSWSQELPPLADQEPSIKAGTNPETGHADEASLPSEETNTAQKGYYVWGKADFLLWWTRNPHVPLLATTGLVTGTRQGAVGAEGTSALYGGGNVDFRDKQGGRFSVGLGLDRDVPIEVELGYFFLNARTTGFAATSVGVPLTARPPVLARPFFNALTNQSDSSVIAYPGVSDGALVVGADSFFQGGEANFAAVLWKQQKFQLSLLAGFRYLDLNESLHTDEYDSIIDPKVAFGGSNIRVTDAFATQNRFYGGQIGMRGGFQMKRWTVDMVGKLALGDTHQNLQIQGNTTINNTPFANSGFLALASNSGTYQRDVFAVVPEVGINLGFKFTDHIQASLGYSFLYWSRVVRPGDQIDLGLNQNLIPTSATFGNAGGPARPAVSFRETDFWAQGVNFGLELRF